MCPLEIKRSLDRVSWSHVATMQPGENPGALCDFNKPKGPSDLIGYHCDSRDTHSIVARSISDPDSSSRKWTVIANIGENQYFDVEVTPKAGGKTWIYRFTQK